MPPCPTREAARRRRSREDGRRGAAPPPCSARLRAKAPVQAAAVRRPAPARGVPRPDEGHECSCVALRRLSGAFDHHATRDDLHDGALADSVITELFPVFEVDDDDSALGRREQHARHLQVQPGDARSIGSRLTRCLLPRGRRQRAKIPAPHARSLVSPNRGFPPASPPAGGACAMGAHHLLRGRRRPYRRPVAPRGGLVSKMGPPPDRPVLLAKASLT
jgi:hypothetical protein